MANISLGVDLPALQSDLNSAVSAISNASKGIASEANKAKPIKCFFNIQRISIIT
jgi:hypothetical protein